MTEDLKSKVEYSVNLIQRAEKLALSYSPEGFYLAFSGGKDSIVLHKLAQMAGVKFTAHLAITTVDPPELLQFVREHYPNAVLHRPPKSMYDLIREKGILPSYKIRYCCQRLKEQYGQGMVTLLGIRAQESYKRSQRAELTKGRKVIELDQFNIISENIVTCGGGKEKILLSPMLR